MMDLTVVITLIVASFLTTIVGPFFIGFTNNRKTAVVAVLAEMAFLLFNAITVAVGANQLDVKGQTSFLTEYIVLLVILGGILSVLVFLLGSWLKVKRP